MCKQVIIIGAGIAGLTAGIYARRSGFDVTILEKHAIPGGMCTSWRRKGYLFEGAIHWLTGSSPKTGINEIWRDVGALSDNVKVIYPEVFASVEWKGKTVCLYRDKVKKVIIKNGIATGVELETGTLSADAVIVTQETIAAVLKLFTTPPKDKWLMKLLRDSKSSVCTFVGVEIRAKIAETPTYERYTGAYRGSWMGIMNKGDKQAQYPGFIKSVKGLYFAGHRMMSPGGLPVALLSGRQAAQMVCRQFKAVFKDK